MKKLLQLLLITSILISWVSGAQASFNPACARLLPAAAVAGSGGSLTMPGLFTGVTSGGLNVSSWLTYTIPGATVAKVAGAVLAVGAGVALEYLFVQGASYVRDKNLAYDVVTGQLSYNVNKTIPDGFTDTSFNTGTWPNGSLKKGYSDTGAAALAACQAYVAACTQCQFSHGCSGPVPSPFTNYKTRFYQGWKDNTGVQAQFDYPWPESGGTGYHEESVREITSAPTVQSNLGVDIAAGDANAHQFGKAAMELAANALEFPGDPLNQNAAIKAAIAAALVEPLTQNQKDAMEAQGVDAGTISPVAEDPLTKANSLTPAQIAAAVQQALVGQNLSAAQIAAAIAAAQSGLTAGQLATALSGAGLSATAIGAAVAAANPGLSAAQVTTATKDALNDETGVTAPSDISFVVPTKLSLTTILTSFMATINNLPFIATLRGLTINCSGSSNLCVSLPAKYGGTVCWEASGITGALNAIGTAMLSLTTIIMFIYIFRSN
jgi:hypothetical protein